MRIVAFDTETYLIADRTTAAVTTGGGEGIHARTGKVLTSPWSYPKVVLGSVAGTLLAPAVYSPADLAALLYLCLLDPTCHLVGHNTPFDMGVMIQFDPSLEPLFEKALEEGRLHDTKLLDQLYGLATGRYDRPRYHPEALDKEPAQRWWAEELKPRSLDEIAQDYVGMTLSKDPDVRLTFNQFDGVPIDRVPERWRIYAQQDAVATLRVYQEITRRMEKAGMKNMLSESLQLKTAWVVMDMDQRGVAIDKKVAAELRKKFLAIQAPLQAKLVADGLGRWDNQPRTIRSCTLAPDLRAVPAGVWFRDGDQIYRWKSLKSGIKTEVATPEFHINVAAVQRLVEATCSMEGAPRRADGTLSLEYDHWASRACGHPTLRAWLDNSKIDKILTTYLNVYSKVDRVFPKWHVLGARSGRMSASQPSVQNVPKRKLGIRALFRPDDGKLMIKADYSAQEMLTLCEAMLNMGIQGPLYDAITSGTDMHRYAAGLILKKKPEDVTKDERQATKILNFGVPGGLGAKSLAEYAYAMYGVQWTEHVARCERDRYLEVFDDVSGYLNSLKIGQDTLLRKLTGMGRKDWAEALELSDWNIIKAMAAHENPDIAEIGQAAERQLTVELATGFRRGNCRFTEGANCYFQGTAAAVTKAAAWKAYRAGLEILLVVHDEIVVQAGPHEQEAASEVLKECMLSAFREICPRIGPYAKVEIDAHLERWGEATDSAGKVLTL